MKTTKQLRDFLKDDIRREVDFSVTDQALEVPMPPIALAVPEDAVVLPLPDWRGVVVPQGSLAELLEDRKSRRGFRQDAMSAQELSYLLWATQGVRKDIPGRVLRTVPSAGNRHPVETFVSLIKPAADGTGGEGIAPGLYRYLPREHGLLYLGTREHLAQDTQQAALDQPFVHKAAAVFFWAVVPYRTEWRYGKASVKTIAIDLGHIGQNLYLACEAAGLGTCAIAAYDQQLCDRLFDLDGLDCFVAYLAPVGRR